MVFSKVLIVAVILFGFLTDQTQALFGKRQTKLSKTTPQYSYSPIVIQSNNQEQYYSNNQSPFAFTPKEPPQSLTKLKIPKAQIQRSLSSAKQDDYLPPPQFSIRKSLEDLKNQMKVNK